jgi:hypothetical protein
MAKRPQGWVKCEDRLPYYRDSSCSLPLATTTTPCPRPRLHDSRGPRRGRGRPGSRARPSGSLAASMQREGAVPESFVLVQAAECHQHRKLAKRDGGEAVREREAARKDVPLTRSHLHEVAADDIGENCNRHLQRSSRRSRLKGQGLAWLGRSGTRSPARPPPGEHNHEQSVLRDAGRANLKDAQPSSHYTQDEDREAAVASKSCCSRRSSALPRRGD